MLQSHLRQPVGRIVDPVARGLLKLGATANLVTAVGAFGVCAMALLFYPRGELFVGTLAVVVFIFSDLLDGTMARLSGRSTRWGAFVDSTLDRVADSTILAALIIFYADQGDDVLLTLTVVSLVAGALVPYVKARAESLGLTCDGGFAERAERLIIILASTGFSGLGLPYIAAIGLWILAAASVLTLVQRIMIVYRQRMVD